VNDTGSFPIDFNRYLQKFTERTLPLVWTERSILTSEAFAFCAIADACGADLILESGVYHGRSTMFWARYFDVPIVAIDRIVQADAIRNLRPFAHVSFDFGDSADVFADLIARHPDKRIACVIDGPKSFRGVELARMCAAQANVHIVAMHDLYRHEPARAAFDELAPACFFTDDDAFVDAYSQLDEGECYRDDGQRLQWQPYRIVRETEPSIELGSYGPTLGIAWTAAACARSGVPVCRSKNTDHRVSEKWASSSS
jgi:hypothetical protein